MSWEAFDSVLNQAERVIGPERNTALEPALYNFIRRYGPMLCVDVVLMPKTDNPSVILAKRGNKAVAPNQWWIFGGRVDKSLDYLSVAEKKLKKEIGIDIKFSHDDIIGLGTTQFPKNKAESIPRNYGVSTANLCFAKIIDLNGKIKEQISPGDGHEGIWGVFNEIDLSWHPYIIHAVVAAWIKLFGKEKTLRKLSREAKRILKDEKHFIPLSFKQILLN